MELHRDVNEIEATVLEIDEPKGVMKIQMKNTELTIPLHEEYKVGDKILALISYDNIFIMLEPQESSIRNVLKGKIIEMKLENEMIRLKVDVDGIEICADITVSASNDLKLTIGKEVYIGFKAVSIATLKL